jgi:hypothetical protein
MNKGWIIEKIREKLGKLVKKEAWVLEDIS